MVDQRAAGFTGGPFDCRRRLGGRTASHARVAITDYRAAAVITGASSILPSCRGLRAHAGVNARARSARAQTVLATALIVAPVAFVLLPATTAVASTASVTFVDPGEQVFIVPAGVNSVGVTLVGAAGGSGGDAANSNDSAAGGPGSVADAQLAVHPDEVLFAEIGGAGSIAGPGANGGGWGDPSLGGGGGGATDVRTCSVATTNPLEPVGCVGTNSLASRLLVAGGGGGAGGASVDGNATPGTGGGGGSGGSGPQGVGGGGGGGADATLANGGGGGGGAMTTGGGTGGGASDGSASAPGVLASGGAGGSQSADDFGGGGGGGGGIYGGGGGGGGTCQPHTSICAGGGGGGGGSSGVPPDVQGVSAVTTSVAGNQTPSVTFTWALPAPTVITGFADNISMTDATLNGVVGPNGSTLTGCDFTLAPAPAGEGSVPCGQTAGVIMDTAAVSVAVSGLTPGTTYSVRLVATNAHGTSTGTPTSFTTPSSTTSTVAPVLSHITQTHSRWRRGNRLAVISRPQPPVGTVFGFTLNEQAQVVMAFSRSVPGHVTSAHRCSPASDRNDHGKTCTAVVSSASLSFQARSGDDTVTFDGRLAHRELPAASTR